MKIHYLITAALATLASPAPAAAEPDRSAATAPVTRMEHISVQSLGAGRPVVLIPGLATPRAVYARTAERLARTHRVLLVQVNGFGGDAAGANDKPGILAGVTDDIARYLDRERLPKASVIGHSMGGVIGMRLARDHPDRIARLMVVDALPFFGLLAGSAATPETLRPVAESMRDAFLAAAARQRSASADDPATATMAISPENRRQISAWSIAADPRVAAQAMVEMMQEDVRGDLPAIAKVATTILYAVPREIADRARALWTGAYASAPAMRLVPVDDSRHFIMLDQPQRFDEEAVDFLTR